MRCFNCANETDENAFRVLSPKEDEVVVDYYGLIHLQGPWDMFDGDGVVILCASCVEKALKEKVED